MEAAQILRIPGPYSPLPVCHQLFAHPAATLAGKSSRSREISDFRDSAFVTWLRNMGLRSQCDACSTYLKEPFVHAYALGM